MILSHWKSDLHATYLHFPAPIPYKTPKETMPIQNPETQLKACIRGNRLAQKATTSFRLNVVKKS